MKRAALSAARLLSVFPCPLRFIFFFLLVLRVQWLRSVNHRTSIKTVSVSRARGHGRRGPRRWSGRRCSMFFGKRSLFIGSKFRCRSRTRVGSRVAVRAFWLEARLIHLFGHPLGAFPRPHSPVMLIRTSPGRRRRPGKKVGWLHQETAITGLVPSEHCRLSRIPLVPADRTPRR